MNTERVAMILGHPAHEFPVLGMISRWRPEVLYLTRANSGGEENREEISGELLGRLLEVDQVTFLGMSELESYERLLAVDMGWYERYLEQMVAWLVERRPTAIFCDAFEFYNVHHDLCSVMVAAAARRAGLDRRLYHLPLACNGSTEATSTPYAEYDRAGWECHYVRLTPEEGAAKRRLLEATAETGVYELPPLLRAVADDRWRLEPYRPAPAARRYAAPGQSFGWPTWEEFGRRAVEGGRYRATILFREHFLPLVRSLGLLEGRRRDRRATAPPQ